MSMSGSLDGCLDKLYTLYMENRINEESTLWYLKHLKHENRDFVFDEIDAEKLLEKLKKDKKEMSGL